MIIVAWSACATCVATELCDPVVDDVAGADGVDGVFCAVPGALEIEDREGGREGALGVVTDGLDGVEMEEAGVLGVDASGEDGARVTEGAVVTDVLGAEAVNVTFLTRLKPQK